MWVCMTPVLVTTHEEQCTASLHGMGGQYGMGKNVLLLFFEHKLIIEKYLYIQRVM